MQLLPLYDLNQKKKISIKIYVDTIFVVNSPEVHKAHSWVTAYGIANKKTY